MNAATRFNVNVDYLPWQPIAGGDISVVGRLTDEHNRLLMAPEHFARLSFILQDTTIRAAAGIFALTVIQNLNLKYTSLSETEAAQLDSCATPQAARAVTLKPAEETATNP